MEPGDQQVTVSFALTPPDTSIGKFMVLCTTVGGKAIKSKKVGNPLAVIKGLTNGERYLFIVAVQDAARVRYDAPTMLSTIPGMQRPHSKRESWQKYSWRLSIATEIIDWMFGSFLHLRHANSAFI